YRHGDPQRHVNSGRVAVVCLGLGGAEQPYAAREARRDQATEDPSVHVCYLPSPMGEVNEVSTGAAGVSPGAPWGGWPPRVADVEVPRRRRREAEAGRVSSAPRPLPGYGRVRATLGYPPTSPSPPRRGSDGRVPVPPAADRPRLRTRWPTGCAHRCGAPRQ